MRLKPLGHLSGAERVPINLAETLLQRTAACLVRDKFKPGWFRIAFRDRVRTVLAAYSVNGKGQPKSVTLGDRRRSGFHAKRLGAIGAIEAIGGALRRWHWLC